LRSLLAASYTVGVILLRLGGYAVGVFDGDELLSSKVGGRFVKNRHRKGGQSQRRYDRTREKQVREHFDSLENTVRAYVEPFAASLDYVVLGGDGHTVAAFLDRWPLSNELREKVIPRFLTVPEPRLAVLKASIREVWQSRLWQFVEIGKAGGPR
jgi:peptide subunit release factor 1 (eRF1)